jgi:cephalosporin hydroxylase
MNEIEKFALEVEKNIQSLGEDLDLHGLSRIWIRETIRHKYSYNFKWMGRPIIQIPQDILVMQEIVWNVRPDLIIETGIAHGGSIIYYASLLELIGEQGIVLGIDIDIRKHNRHEIEKHPMFERITMIEGSSVDKSVAETVFNIARTRKKIVLILDSNHTHDHVLKELQIYSPLVTKGSYLVVCDTIIEDMPDEFFPDRPWGKGNNPKTAVQEFLKKNDRFVIDTDIDNKLLISVSPNGYLKCIKD